MPDGAGIADGIHIVARKPVYTVQASGNLVPQGDIKPLVDTLPNALVLPQHLVLGAAGIELTVHLAEIHQVDVVDVQRGIRAGLPGRVFTQQAGASQEAVVTFLLPAPRTPLQGAVDDFGDIVDVEPVVLVDHHHPGHAGFRALQVEVPGEQRLLRPDRNDVGEIEGGLALCHGSVPMDVPQVPARNARVV